MFHLKSGEIFNVMFGAFGLIMAIQAIVGIIRGRLIERGRGRRIEHTGVAAVFHGLGQILFGLSFMLIALILYLTKANIE